MCARFTAPLFQWVMYEHSCSPFWLLAPDEDEGNLGKVLDMQEVRKGATLTAAYATSKLSSQGRLLHISCQRHHAPWAFGVLSDSIGDVLPRTSDEFRPHVLQMTEKRDLSASSRWLSCSVALILEFPCYSKKIERVHRMSCCPPCGCH